MEIRPGGPQADDGGGIVGEPLAGSLGRGQAPPLHFGGPPPRHVFAPDLLCPLMVHALRSTRRPLTNHPNEPRATDEGRKGVGGDSPDGTPFRAPCSPWIQIGQGVSIVGGAWSGEAEDEGDPLSDPYLRTVARGSAGGRTEGCCRSKEGTLRIRPRGQPGACSSRSALAAQTKSLSVRPSIL